MIDTAAFPERIPARELRDSRLYQHGDKRRDETTEQMFKRKRKEARQKSRGFRDPETGWRMDITLATSIQRNGIKQPIEIAIYSADATGITMEVADGHHRLAVVDDDYLVPVMYCDYTDSDEYELDNLFK